MTVDPHYGQLMAEHMTTAVVTLDASDHVLAMNPAAEALFRLSRRLAHGRRLPAWLSDGGQPLAACLRRTAVDGGRSAAQRALTLRLAADRRVTVDCTVTPLDEVAVGVMLLQALLNLVRNAAQALTGAPRPQITIRTRVQGAVTIGARHHRQMVCVEIIDNGPGIPAELQRTVFYPMVTGRSDGVGLGLPIAQSLAHHHGGLIEFDSAPGRTVFSVYLPLSQQRAKGA